MLAEWSRSLLTDMPIVADPVTAGVRAAVDDLVQAGVQISAEQGLCRVGGGPGVVCAAEGREDGANAAHAITVASI